MAVIVAVGIWASKGREDGARPDFIPNDTVDAGNQPAPSATPEPAFERLLGQWQRPDGGYILEILSVSPNGVMDAAYYNPQSINVAKAEASWDGKTVRVFVELRDVNYPGSIYTLTYEPASDQLRGIYFQAVWQQQFDVFFVRLK